jgi:hypothetical protein
MEKIVSFFGLSYFFKHMLSHMYKDQKCKRASLKVQNSRFHSHGKFSHKLDDLRIYLASMHKTNWVIAKILPYTYGRDKYFAKK